MCVGVYFMKNPIPFEKLSKKEQKKLNNKKRGNWFCVNPTTRIIVDKTKYTRKKKHKDTNL